jgi:hypothetical protein
MHKNLYQQMYLERRRCAMRKHSHHAVASFACFFCNLALRFSERGINGQRTTKACLVRRWRNGEWRRCVRCAAEVPRQAAEMANWCLYEILLLINQRRSSVRAP